MKRILYVEGNVDTTIGGSYFSLYFLTSRLDRYRFEPIVVFSTENELIPRFRAAGIRTIVRSPLAPVTLTGFPGRLASKVINFIRGGLVEPVRLALLLRREDISLVHLNNSIIKNHSWMIAALIAGIPCITHERGINSGFKLRARLLARSLGAIICISSAVHENFLKLGLGHLRLMTVHNGLDAEDMLVTRSALEIRAELDLPSDARLVGMVGNIKAWKGQEVVVRALGQLREEFPTLVCLLIGDTSPSDLGYRARIEQCVDELDLNGRVIITGYREDVANYVNALEIQIHASVAPEPFGRVLLEAMALAKPLVASGGGAVPEILIHGKTGLIFEPGNVDALAASLRTLLKDPTNAAAMGRSGRDRLAKQFSIRRHVDEIERIYDLLLDV